MKDMGYTSTFIQVAPDCPATRGVVPVARGDRKPIHVIQYELLAGHPYRYTHADLLVEVHIRHKALAQVDARVLREELLARPHPCLRASMLPKKYGWGVHYDERGRIALHGRESEEYQRYTRPGGVPNLVIALRSKRT